MLPPPSSYYRALELGFVYDDGVGARELARVAANPSEFEKVYGRPPARGPWAAGPTPPLSKAGGRIKPPADATEAVYRWLRNESKVRLEAVKDHLETGSPSVDRMAFMFSTTVSKVRDWVKTASRILREGGEISPPPLRRFQPKELKLFKGAIYFGSGAEGSPGEIAGSADLARRYKGFGVGVDVSKCRSHREILALELEASNGVPLFVDSGAFGEFTQGTPITDKQWVERLRNYYHLAKLYKTRAYLVAPDKIGNQKETRRRVLKKENLDLIKKCAEKGAWILLAAQGSKKKSRHAFWKKLRDDMVKRGVPKKKIVAALPMKERAMTLEEVQAFVDNVPGLERIHFLGKGPARIGPYLEIAKEAGLKTTFDSVLIKSGAVRGFLGVSMRVYLYAQDIVRYAIMSVAFQKSYRGGESLENWIDNVGWDEELVPEYTDLTELVNDWLPPQYRKLLAAELNRIHKITKRQVDLLVKNPYEFLQAPMRGEGSAPWYEDPVTDSWLDDQWARFLGCYYSAVVKRDAVVKAWRRGDFKAAVRETPALKEAVDNPHLMWTFSEDLDARNPQSCWSFGRAS